MKAIFLIPIISCLSVSAFSQTVQKVSEQPSKVWVSDLGNGSYKNPVLHADYSDPDVCRVGDNFYMTASSFDAVPGLPILHSKDLVNWKLIGHALKRQVPIEHFEKTQHGNGVWAPAIRFHNQEFYIYYPDPDFGIYLTKAKSAHGPWSEPVLVEGGKGLIDPCPLWDDNGKVYLAHGWAGSRAGIKSILTVKELNATGDKVLDNGVVVYDGHELDPTVEGPKFYKRNGFYYIFAPAGGVATGWQLALRSKNVYGPYERKVVMDQGKSTVNGPHQGAWVDTKPVNGKSQDWFIHFQDKNEYGRVVHLQPMKWVNDWPVIGADPDGDGKGEPVTTYRKPDVALVSSIATPPESDEFNSLLLGKQWQWQANAKGTWFTTSASGFLRLYSYKSPEPNQNLWTTPNILLQKFPAEQFTATTKVIFTPNTKLENEKAGLVVMGLSYAALYLKSTKDGLELIQAVCLKAAEDKPEKTMVIERFKANQTVYLRVQVTQGGACQFSYSFDNQKYLPAGGVFKAEVGRWIGAKMGLFCTRETQINDSGYADFDWFHIEPVR
ncbi:glycoside hydrolase family 43 protein [Dyadobacter psychrotolerans]|uniref:Glycosyl hydrolase 43 family protein n=1 Tax=Dyadobacter psychrotolerans TaxID=2541721 RepID=A0A4R5DPR0_9BACT|nr:glycoside hydrolase 43 family protein [Dyadobacter psychrotolerans]TDE15587.1 glycosyl hydrolase 43 family protein [Dyadobacter psychrotolerans]